MVNLPQRCFTTYGWVLYTREDGGQTPRASHKDGTVASRVINFWKFLYLLFVRWPFRISCNIQGDNA
jgi:hypothetical protein